jgi:hypothetical protein
MPALLKRNPLAHVERYAGAWVTGTLEEAGRFADSGLHADDLAARDSGDLEESCKSLQCKASSGVHIRRSNTGCETCLNWGFGWEGRWTGELWRWL